MPRPRPLRSPALRLFALLRLWGNSRGPGKSGYKGQRRVLQRWKGPLEHMRLISRARGDRKARICLSGLMAPGVTLGDGSLWMLPLGRAGRREERQLRRGRAPRQVKRTRKPDGLYFGSYQGLPLRMLKPRAQARPMRLRR